MKPRRPLRAGLVVGLSLLAHGAVLALLALSHPQLRIAPPPPVVEVEIVPYFLPSLQRAQPRSEPLAAQPIRPRRSLQRPDEERTVAPLITKAAPPQKPVEGPWAVAPPVVGTPSPSPPDLRRALRGSVGCSNLELLSKAEREDCQEKLGAGAKDAPFIPPPIAADKLKAWEADAARKRAKWKAREAPMPQAVPSGPSSPSQAPNPFPEVWTPHN